MNFYLRHSGLILAVLCCSTAFTPSLVFAASPTPTPPPASVFPPKPMSGTECNGTDYQVLAWKKGDSLRCLNDVKLTPSGDMKLPNVVSTGNITTTSGNLDVGTDTPAKKLDVVGDSRITGALNTGSLSTGSISGASITTTGPASLASATVGGTAVNPTALQMANNLAALLPTCASGTPLLVSGGQITCATPTPTPPASCPATAKTWTVGSYTCSGTSTALSAGATGSINSSNGYSGTMSVTCSNGTLIENATPAKTCTATACAAQSMSWTANGVSCQGSSSSLNNGQTQSVSSTNGNTGTKPVICSNGTLSSNGTATCATPAPSGCAATGVNWQVNGAACSGPFPTTAEGLTVRVNANPGFTGWADFTCSGGMPQVTANKSCTTPTPAPAGCVASTVSWSTCQGTTTAASNGQTQTITSTTTSTGSYPVACSNGTWVSNGTATCATPAPCSPKAITWSQNGLNCTGSLPLTASGSSTPDIISTNDNWGVYKATCQNGVFSPTTATCQSIDCMALTLVSWTGNGSTCYSRLPDPTKNGTTVTLSTTAGQSYIGATSDGTGSAQFRCSQGTHTLLAGSTCVKPTPTPTPANCASTNSISWQSADGQTSCASGTVPALNSGSSTTVTSITGGTGSATVTCTNGVLSRTGTCTPAATAPCTATNVNWTYNGVACSGWFPATNHGVTVRVNANAGFTGWADYTCNNGFRQVSSTSKYCQ